MKLCNSARWRAQIRLRPLAANAWEFSGTLRNTGTAAVELARFHYFHGTLADASARELFVPSELGVASQRFRGRTNRLPPNRGQN